LFEIWTLVNMEERFLTHQPCHIAVVVDFIKIRDFELNLLLYYFLLSL